MSSNNDHNSSTPPNAPAGPSPDGGSGGDTDGGFCRWYINRWGRLMVASDYGYEAWHFRDKTKKS